MSWNMDRLVTASTNWVGRSDIIWLPCLGHIRLYNVFLVHWQNPSQSPEIPHKSDYPDITIWKDHMWALQAAVPPSSTFQPSFLRCQTCELNHYELARPDCLPAVYQKWLPLMPHGTEESLSQVLPDFTVYKSVTYNYVVVISSYSISE